MRGTWLPIWWRHKILSQSAVLLRCFTLVGYVPSTWPPEYKRLRAVYVATRSGLNQCSSITKQVIMTFFDYVSIFYLILLHFSLLSSYGKSFWLFVYVIIYCVGAGIITLIFISDWSDPYIFRRKMEKTRSVKEEMEGKLFISRQSRHIFFVMIMIKVLFPTLYLYLACKQLCFPPRKRYK